MHGLALTLAISLAAGVAAPESGPPPVRHATCLRFFSLEGDVKPEALNGAVRAFSVGGLEARIALGPVKVSSRPKERFLALEVSSAITPKTIEAALKKVSPRTEELLWAAFRGPDRTLPTIVGYGALECIVGMDDDLRFFELDRGTARFFYAPGRLDAEKLRSKFKKLYEPFQAGDVGYVPQGYGHSIENIGAEDLDVVVVFNNRALGWVKHGPSPFSDFRDFDLRACIEECIPLIASKAREREIVVEADLPAAAILVVADARACKQILINLLSNAVKFSEEKGIITVTLKDLGETVQFSVKDEGTGIPADVLERIGQPFEQATNNPHVAREGTGLGLSLVKALVGEHGGKMAVASREDEGTTVTITLPRRQERRKIQRAA